MEEWFTLADGITKVKIIDHRRAYKTTHSNGHLTSLVACPTCEKSHWVEGKHMMKPCFTGLCLHCSNLIQIRHTFPQKANNPQPSFGEANRLWKKKTPVINNDASFHHTEEHNKQVSQKLLGRTKTPETCARIAAATRLRWQDPEYRKAHLDPLMGTPEKKAEWQKAIRGGQKKHPNRNELKVQGYLDRLFPDEYKFVGNDENYEINNRYPDHLNISGQRKVILAHGVHWHGNDDIRIVIQQYADAGYDCLFMWEHENKDVVLSEAKLREFHEMPQGNVEQCIELSTMKLPRPKWS